MVMGTRNAPTFPHDVQKQLWDIRRESTVLSGFKFKEELEERLIQSLSVEEATAAVAEAEKELEAWKASQRKKGKKPAKPTSDEPVGGGEGTSGGGDKDQTEDPELESEHEGEGKGKASSEKPSGVEPVAETPSDPDDSDGDERGKTSRSDRERVRGRTPRVETGGQSKKKLFKMTPPAKFFGDKDKERTYETVQLFLSQVSRYLRLSTDVDMDGDIAEYVLAFLDGFAYTWFDNLDKGSTPYLWKDFEAAMRKKFIPFSHIQKAITKYNAIKQINGKSVAEYIVEREAMESMLGDELSAATIAGSFRENLNKWIRDRLIPFADLPYDQYKHKAEVTDQEAQDQKVGPYASTREQSSRPFGKKGSRTGGGNGSGNSNSNAGNTSKSGGKGGKKPQMSKKEMREKGVCFNCYEQGHLARDCPHPRRDGQKKSDSKPESNSIRIQEPDVKAKRNLYHKKRDSRSYSNVVSGQGPPPPPPPHIPAIGLKETTPISDSSVKPKPPPMFAKLPINGVESKSLIDTGSSDDFIGTHFATVNRISVRNRETPVAIQQAIKGSKPKTNATAKVGIQFGEWTKNMEAHVAGLAGYDAIIGVPTLTDGDAVIDVAARTVYFRAWDFTVHCEIPEVPPKRPKKGGRWKGGKKAVDSFSKSQSSSAQARAHPVGLTVRQPRPPMRAPEQRCWRWTSIWNVLGRIGRRNRESLWLPQQRRRSPRPLHLLHLLHLLVPTRSLKTSIKTVHRRIIENCSTRNSSMSLWTNFLRKYLRYEKSIIGSPTTARNRTLRTSSVFLKLTSKPSKKSSSRNSSPVSCDSPLRFRLQLHILSRRIKKENFVKFKI